MTATVLIAEAVSDTREMRRAELGSMQVCVMPCQRGERRGDVGAVARALDLRRSGAGRAQIARALQVVPSSGALSASVESGKTLVILEMLPTRLLASDAAAALSVAPRMPRVQG